MQRKHNLVVLASLGLAVLASCGTTQESTTQESTTQDSSSTSASTTATSVEAGYRALTPAATDALLHDPPDGLVVVDVRTPEEFAAGHIAGAVNIDLQGATFETDVAELDPSKPYLVYCRTGNRSAQAVAYVQQHDFRSIYELSDGIAAWQTAGLPVVTA